MNICNPKNKKTNSLILKWTKDLNRQFYEEDTQMTNKFIKRNPARLTIKEVQIKITKNHFIFIRIIIERESGKYDADDMEKP